MRTDFFERKSSQKAANKRSAYFNRNNTIKKLACQASINFF
jgi:hypothetical protein